MSKILIGALVAIYLVLVAACATVPAQVVETEAETVAVVEEVPTTPEPPATPEPPTTQLLPMFYVVQLIPANRDSLSKIASYDFVYGNGALWPLLYRANRDKLRRPANPDLIHPGTVLEIPSVGDEVREGTWEDQ